MKGVHSQIKFLEWNNSNEIVNKEFLIKSYLMIMPLLRNLQQIIIIFLRSQHLQLRNYLIIIILDWIKINSNNELKKNMR